MANIGWPLNFPVPGGRATGASPRPTDDASPVPSPAAYSVPAARAAIVLSPLEPASDEGNGDRAGGSRGSGEGEPAYLSATDESLWPANFPMPGARRTLGGRRELRPGGDGQSTEVERHQRSQNGPTPDDPYSRARLHPFPVPGSRPPRQTHGPPSEEGFALAAAADGLAGQREQAGPSAGPSARAAPAPPAAAADPVMAFLAHMPEGIAEPSAQMWHELVQLKTKSLELQIAEARRREREADLELLRLQHAMATAAGTPQSTATPAAAAAPLPTPPRPQAQALPPMPPPPAPAPAAGPSAQTQAQLADPLADLQGINSPYSTFPLVTHARSPVMEGVSYPDQLVPSLAMPQPGPPPPQQQQQQHELAPQTPMTPFDLEAMLHAQEGPETFDNLFNWLPDFGAGANQLGALMPDMPLSAAPSDLLLPSATGASSTSGPFAAAPMARQMSGAGASAAPHSSPKKSPALDSPPPAKKKKLAEKKVVAEHAAVCRTCGAAIAKVLLRAPRATFPSPVVVDVRCPDCTGVHQPPSIDPASAHSHGTQVGSQETRKRMRAAMEDADLMADERTRRCFCDVCHRVVGSGWIAGGPDEENLAHMAEIVCVSCDSKYQRCTDCGGGGGPRVGIGKWRLKQVFHPGRKTCSLSHSRLGDRMREIGLHVTPTDFAPEQLKEVVTRCRTLWQEKTLSRLAVPEMLEIDLPPHLINPIRNYDDIDDIVTRNWPAREATIRADGVDPSRFKRLLGLTWAHAKPRRSVRSVDLEEAHARAIEADETDDMSTVLANVKRTNVVIPAGSELIGMWGGEWDMEHGSLLISTIIPFEDTDSEDSTALSVGELITKVQKLRNEINAERSAAAAAEGREPQLLPQCEHLWVVSGGHMPLIRARLGDVLIRKRSFVHVEEYLTRHPDFIHALKARPGGLHPDTAPLPHQMDAHPGYRPPEPIVFVRWLGKDFDAQTVNEIKQAEFGGSKGRARLKKPPRSSRP